MKTPDILFLASGNTHKISELNEVLQPLDIDLKSTLDISDPGDVEEDQPDLQGNALKKAKHWYRETGLPSLADDTGLEVDALDGSPGVYSARYAGENASYEENTQKLLKELQGESDRSAQFRTVIAFIDQSGEEHLFEGVCRGAITTEKRGEKGFGYDPVFVPEEYNRTFAELSSEEKNSISHRGIAIQKFLRYLK
ncbi:RdgB/HAM1 family non-canonical purine NTP pyrophosphatase [Rhodohalobacter sp. 8-1]|uniref:RdgB/HAM1 family non-canonical purine NTP pyrophosphatase n=1 Tax=Rhodohalobacter sp. 8-1 TaxID=3131972 RepID=UPI0030EB19EB